MPEAGISFEGNLVSMKLKKNENRIEDEGDQEHEYQRLAAGKL